MFFHTDTETCDLRKHMSLDYRSAPSIRYGCVFFQSRVPAPSVNTRSYRRLTFTHRVLVCLCALLTKLDKLQARAPPPLARLAPLASRLPAKLTPANQPARPERSCLINLEQVANVGVADSWLTYSDSPEVINRLSARGWKSRLYVEVMVKTTSI